MKEENSKFPINLHVCDTVIKAYVLREEEPSYRSAAKMITDTVNMYSATYGSTKSLKEILYMAMIDITLKLQQERTHNDTEPYDDILTKITTEIEDALDVKSGKDEGNM